MKRAATTSHAPSNSRRKGGRCQPWATSAVGPAPATPSPTAAGPRAIATSPAAAGARAIARAIAANGSGCEPHPQDAGPRRQRRLRPPQRRPRRQARASSPAPSRQRSNAPVATSLEKHDRLQHLQSQPTQTRLLRPQ
jgi:hypothetical protein